MRKLDRYIIKAFLVNYLLALGVMVGLYILFDLIVNFDNFTSNARGAFPIIRDIADYYSFQSLLVFQYVSGIIPTMAAGFTMIRMTRHNELSAILASGISLYRVATPIIICAIAISLLTVVNQEFVVSHPPITEKLLRKHSEVSVQTARNKPVYFVRDFDNSLLQATEYNADTRTLLNVRIIQRDEKTGSPVGRITADMAVWKPNPDGRSFWEMTNVKFINDRASADPAKRFPEIHAVSNYYTEITPEQLDLIFQKRATEFLSSADLRRLINTSPEVNQPALMKNMHSRITKPIMNIIMLLIGIPFLLTREPNRLIVNMMYCSAVTGLVFIGNFVIMQVTGTMIDPLLGAWLPIVLFAPLAVVMLDTVQT